jgi:hypothetical protein
MPATLRPRAAEDGVALYERLRRAIHDHSEAFSTDYKMQLSISIDDFVANGLTAGTGDGLILRAF